MDKSRFLWITLEQTRNDTSRPPWREVGATALHISKARITSRIIQKSSSMSLPSVVHGFLVGAIKLVRTGALYVARGTVKHGLPVYLVDEFVNAAAPRALPVIRHLLPLPSRHACLVTPDQATRCPIPPCLPCVALPSRALRYRAGAYRSQTSRVKPALCFRAAPIHVRPFRATLRLTQPKPVARCQSGRDLPCRALPVPAGTRLPFQNVPIRTMPNSAETFQIRPWHA